jgi:hypothetical protein
MWHRQWPRRSWSPKQVLHLRGHSHCSDWPVKAGSDYRKTMAGHHEWILTGIVSLSGLELAETAMVLPWGSGIGPWLPQNISHSRWLHYWPQVLPPWVWRNPARLGPASSSTKLVVPKGIWGESHYSALRSKLWVSLEDQPKATW